MSTEAVDYFSNHKLKLRFPWRLYHAPIVDGLADAIRRAPGPDILNLGSGPFFELESVPRDGRRFTVCDIDERAIEFAKRLHGDKLAGADVVPPGAPLPYPDGRFDLVVAMEVIEHLPDPVPWLREVMRVVKPGGAIYLTTPNYGSLSLNVLERTALEVVARVQGFTRKGMHPTPLDSAGLRRLLADVGAVDIDVRTMSFGWVAAAHARKPRAA